MGQKLMGCQLSRFKELAAQGYGTFTPGEVTLLLGHIKELDDDVKIRDLSMKRMQEQLDQAREGERFAVAAADRLQDNVIQLEGERQALADKLLAKKVVLPWKVAEAIAYYDSQELTNFGIIRSITDCKDKTAKDALMALEQLIGLNEDESDIIMKALVNGYTVEELPTAEERMRAKVDALLDEHEVESPIPRERLVELLMLAAREAVAESQQAETQ